MRERQQVKVDLLQLTIISADLDMRRVALEEPDRFELVLLTIFVDLLMLGLLGVLVKLLVVG